MSWIECSNIEVETNLAWLTPPRDVGGQSEEGDKGATPDPRDRESAIGEDAPFAGRR